jgi:hypothetical protein
VMTVNCTVFGFVMPYSLEKARCVGGIYYWRHSAFCEYVVLQPRIPNSSNTYNLHLYVFHPVLYIIAM